MQNTISKPSDIKSAKIKKQKYNDCWIHSVSRNFVRTLQILDVIKSTYVDKFYALFYIILTKNNNCDDGGKIVDGCVILFDYLKNNFSNIFSVKYDNEYILSYVKKENNTYVFDMNDDDKQKFIDDMTYLFSNDILFLGKYDYVVNPLGNNKPSEAIKKMLYYKLQPSVGIKFNKYLYEQIVKQTTNFPTIEDKPNFDNECIHNDNEPNDTSGHSINLRKWNKYGIEFKNSYGIKTSNEGNFSVKDLNYVICKKNNTNYDNVIFASLMFDYDILSNEYKNRVNKKLCKYWKTFDDSLETEETNYYIGSYNKFGLFDGNGELFSDVGLCKSNFKNGFMHGYGKITSDTFIIENYFLYSLPVLNINKIRYSNGNKYEGQINKNYEFNGYGKFTHSNGSFYEGEYKNNRMHGYGKYVIYGNNNNIIASYEGEYFDGKQTGKGIRIETSTQEGIFNNGILVKSESVSDFLIEQSNLLMYKKNKLIIEDEHKLMCYEKNNLNHENKYLKYKLKYLKLKNQKN